MKPKIEISSNEEDAAQQADEVRKLREQQLEDIKTLLAMPAGLRFFKRLLTEGKMFTTTFTGNSNTFFLEGHRNLALKFFGDVCEAAPEKIPELIVDSKS